MRGLILMLVGLLAGLNLFGQTNDTANVPYWIEMMQDPNGNFYQTQRAFETYWKGRARTKGDGYKPFKRWEWFMQSEINPDGTYRNPDVIQQEVMNFVPASNYLPAFGGNQVQATNGKWENLGPVQKPVASSGQPNGMGRINGIGLHPTNDSIIFIGSPNGGVWRTYNHGQTWESNTDTNFVMQISELKFHPKNPSIVYAGTGDRDAGARSPRGVMKSTDGGIHWSVSNTGMGNLVVGKMILDPNYPDTLVAATSGGVYRSVNGAQSWTKTSVSSSHFKDVVYCPSNFQIQYATAGGDFYRSSDGGQTWSSISLPVNGNRIAIAVTPNDPSYVYLVQTTQRAFAALMLSTDTGKTFTTQSTSPNIMDWSTTGGGSSGQAWYDLDIACNPKNKAEIWVGGVNIFKSTDEGKTWRINAHWTGSGGVPAVHADHHVFEWSEDGDRLYTGNDGGIYYTDNGGLSWTDLSSGLPISEVYKIGQHRYNEDAVICGYQDNGSAIYRGPGNWTTEIGGDGMECAFDYSNNNYVYGALYYGAIRRSANGGRSFSGITGGISEQGAWVTPYILDEGDPKIMYVGMNTDIWRTLNVRSGSVSWTNISSNSGIGGSGAWSVLESSPANPNILYAVRTGKTLIRTDNAHASNPTWTNLTVNLPAGSAPSDVEAHPWDENIVYITSGSKVHVSTDKGQSWTDISGNLPNTAKRTIVYDRYSKGGIYVGGTPLIYYRDSTLNNWIEYSNGFPGDVSVTELEIFYDTLNPLRSKLRAGTYGRGLWSVDLFEIEKRLPEAKFRGDTGFFCTSNSLKWFADSSRNVEKVQWIILPDTGYTFINNTNSASLNAEIQFAKSGFYSLNLVVSNYFGKDTVLLKNQILIGDPKTGYCSTSTSASSTTNQGISFVGLEQISKTSLRYNGTQSNQNYTCGELAILEPDSTYTFNITTGNNEYAKVFIDYNNDGDFTDMGEEVLSFTQGSGTRSASFTVPSATAVNVALRMRVISDIASISGACAALMSGESEDYTVWIDKPQVQVHSTSASACPNYPTQFWATTTGKVDSLLWDFGTLASPRFAWGLGPHTARYSGSGIWKVKVRLNADRWFEDSIQIIASPTADIILDSANSSLCEGGYAKLLVVNNSGVAGNFSWYWNGNPISGKSDSVLNIKNLNAFVNYNYQVVTGNGSCFDTSDVFTLQPHDRPTAWIGIIKSVQCLDGNEFLFNDNSLFMNGSLTRKWDFGDGAIDTNKNARHSYAQTGSYTVKLLVTSNKNCSDTSSTMVTVSPNPDSTFLIKPVKGMTYEFIPNDTTHASYSWNFGDSNTSTLKVPQHTFTKGGIYLVSLAVTGINGCTGLSSEMQQVEDVNISLEQFSEWFGVRVYPNPSKKVFYLELEGERQVNYTLRDAQGRLIETGESNGEMLSKRFDVKHPGLYLLQVKIDQLEATYKLTVY